MVTSSDAPDDPDPPDTTMDEASESPMSSMYDEYTSSTKTPEKILIKLLFKQSSNNYNANLHDKHRLVLERLHQADPQITIFDQHDIVVPLHNPSKINFSTRFKYSSLPRRHFKMTASTHSIQSTISFSQLKKKLNSVLQENRITMMINHWKTLDIRDVGWLCNAHTYFHNRDHLQDILHKAIRKQFPSKPIPEFRLYVRMVTDGKPNSSNRLTAKAIHIECPSMDLNHLRDILQSLYSKVKGLPGTFVPANLPHISDQPLLRKYILQQAKYTDNHRNITIEGVEHSHLAQTIHHNGKPTTILSMIKRSSSIFWISQTEQSDKWHLSTTLHHYPMAAQFVQTHILDRIEGSTSNRILTDEQTVHTTVSDSTKSYLEVLSSTSSHFDVDQSVVDMPATTPKQISFSKDTTPTSVSHLSSLDPTSTKRQAIEIDNIKEHVQRSLSNLRKEFEQFKKDIRTEVQTTIHDLLQAQNEKLTDATELMDTTSILISEEMKTLKEQNAKDMQELRDTISSFTASFSSPHKRHKSEILTQEESSLGTATTQSMSIEEIDENQLP